MSAYKREQQAEAEAALDRACREAAESEEKYAEAVRDKEDADHAAWIERQEAALYRNFVASARALRDRCGWDREAFILTLESEELG